MGEIADQILHGVLCQECGGYINGEAAGIPRTCDDCLEPPNTVSQETLDKLAADDYEEYGDDPI